MANPKRVAHGKRVAGAMQRDPETNRFVSKKKTKASTTKKKATKKAPAKPSTDDKPDDKPEEGGLFDALFSWLDE